MILLIIIPILLIIVYSLSGVFKSENKPVRRVKPWYECDYCGGLIEDCECVVNIKRLVK